MAVAVIASTREIVFVVQKGSVYSQVLSTFLFSDFQNRLAVFMKTEEASSTCERNAVLKRLKFDRIVIFKQSYSSVM
jgi:hypothetical protein